MAVYNMVILNGDVKCRSEITWQKILGTTFDSKFTFESHLIGCFRGVVVRERTCGFGAKLVQGACVRTPPTTVPGNDMAGDVKSALNLFQLGIRFQGKPKPNL